MDAFSQLTPIGGYVLLWREEKFTSPIADRMHGELPGPPTEELKRTSARGGNATGDLTFANCADPSIEPRAEFL
jgi:hypothetical protein